MRSLNHNLVIVPLHGCVSYTNTSKINRLHERCLRIIHSDKQSSFETLLEKDGSFLFKFGIFKFLQLKYIK